MDDLENPNSTDKALKRLITKLTKETLWIYILRLLQDKPMYGYEIRDKISKEFDFDPARVTTYVVLYKMAKEGLVSSEWQKSPSGKPDRRYYKISGLGQQMMKEASVFLKKTMKVVFNRSNSE